MRTWWSDLLQRNREEGPKPSGICLWQDVKGLEQLVQQLANEAIGQADDWEKLHQHFASLQGERAGGPRPVARA